MSGRKRWYAYWQDIAQRAVRAARAFPAGSPQREAAGYAVQWAGLWRRASPDDRIAALGIPSPTPEHNMLLAQAEQLARTPS